MVFSWPDSLHPLTQESYVFVVLLLADFFCNPMDCSPPGSSVYGIFQARILEWVAISFSVLGHMIVLFMLREASILFSISGKINLYSY